MIEDLQNLAEIISMSLSRFFRMPGDQNSIDRVGPIEGSFIPGTSEDGAQNRLDMLQCRCREIVRFGDRAASDWHPRCEILAGAALRRVANVIDPDFVVALAGAGSTLLLRPRQVRSFDESGHRYSRICTEPIAIDRLHE